MVESMTSVWPALWPPWKRTTTSARSESQSTILPLPSSPHCEPTTTTFVIFKSCVPGHTATRPNAHQPQSILIWGRYATPIFLGAAEEPEPQRHYKRAHLYRLDQRKATRLCCSTGFCVTKASARGYCRPKLQPRRHGPRGDS